MLPRDTTRAVEHLICSTIGLELKDKQVLGFAAESNGSTLSGFDLHEATVRSTSIVSLHRCGEKFERIAMCSDDFADAANEMPVGRELATREERLKLGDYVVEALNELGDAVN